MPARPLHHAAPDRQLLGQRRLQQLARVEVVLLDDFGLQKLGTGEWQDLLEVLEDRCGVRATIVTSQLKVDDWHEAVVSTNPTLADAILYRLLPNAHRIELGGETGSGRAAR